MSRLTLLERIETHLDKTGDCWLWTGSLSHNGYGHIHVGRTVARVHRLVYTLLVGPIPRGLHLDHVEEWGCTSRACCNPNHLEPVTQAENNRRAAARRRLRALPARSTLAAAA